jgi:hypothetical protein
MGWGAVRNRECLKKAIRSLPRSLILCTQRRRRHHEPWKATKSAGWKPGLLFTQLVNNYLLLFISWMRSNCLQK